MSRGQRACHRAHGVPLVEYFVDKLRVVERLVPGKSPCRVHSSCFTSVVPLLAAGRTWPYRGQGLGIDLKQAQPVV